MPVTIYDIAKEVGTSHATVSRALRGHAGVAPATRKKVARVAGELRYRPDQAARMLKAGKTQTIGLILPESVNPYYIEFFNIVQDLCQQRGYQVFPMDYRFREDLEKICMEMMLERRCDGCIAFILRFDPLRAIIDECWASKLPLVVAGLPEGIKNTRVDGYRLDFSRSMREAIQHLANLGHRHIVFAGSWPEESGVGNDRFSVLRETFAECGLDWSPDRIMRYWTGRQLEDGYASAKLLFDALPETTAILGVNDLFCVGLMRGLAEMGIRIPDDVSLIGTDDTWLARYWPVPMTSISQNTTEQAAFAVEALFERLEGTEWQVPRHVTLRSKLVIRQSTAAPRK